MLKKLRELDRERVVLIFTQSKEYLKRIKTVTLSREG